MEIIVIDNYSMDMTVPIAKTFTDKVYQKGPERSTQRNLGIMKARGEYCLILDCDMTLTMPFFIRNCVAQMENGVVGLYITERITGTNFWANVRNFERGFYNGTVIDCIRFMRTHMAKEIGGFDSSMTGPEDWDFDRRMKAKGIVKIANECTIYHNESYFHLSRYLNKKLYYFPSFKPYQEKWGYDKTTRKQLGFWYRFIGVFVENGKWILLVQHPILTVLMYYIRFALAWRLICRKLINMRIATLVSIQKKYQS
jgi:glycosyltransferase involved in cell wall biosynthesis